MRFLDEYINSLMLWSEFTAQFWPILSFDQKYCLTYVVGVVTMADLLQNQQNKNLWAVPVCLHIICEWKRILICDLLLQDHDKNNGKSSEFIQT